MLLQQFILLEGVCKFSVCLPHLIAHLFDRCLTILHALLVLADAFVQAFDTLSLVLKLLLVNLSDFLLFLQRFLQSVDFYCQRSNV